jgi:hypothetical protein
LAKKRKLREDDEEEEDREVPLGSEARCSLEVASC